MSQTLRLQQALKALGFDPGPIDGTPGVLTTTAVRRYQLSRNVDPDGIVGPKTLAKLAKDGFPIVREADEPAPRKTPDALTPWMDEARGHLGLAEVVGPRHNPTILGWAKALGAKVLGINVTDDETPWCGIFAGFCMARGLPSEPLPIIAVRASSWATFGDPLKEGAYGAVLVFSRQGGGHVGFYVGEDDQAFHVLGGNQGNRVSVIRKAKAELVTNGIRWPHTVALPRGGPIHATLAQSLSTNEA